MKKIFNYCKSETAKKQTAFLPFTLCAALFLGFVFPLASFAQSQFVKTYSAISPCQQKQNNLIFNCITKSQKSVSTFYIAGVQDSAVYVAEVNTLGVVLQEKLIGVNSKTYSLRSMITDEDGNIVMVGTTEYGATSVTPIGSFMMKVSPALSILLHRTYKSPTFTASNQLLFLDVKDNKATDTYYVCGGGRYGSTVANDVVLFRLDRTNGNVIVKSRYDAGEDNYDALVFPSKNDTANGKLPGLIATGRLSAVGTSTMRPWINRHDGALAFVNGRRFIQDLQPSGRLYSSSLISDASNVVYCWHGDVSTLLGVGANGGISSFDETSLLPNWQYDYILTPKPQLRKFFNKVNADPRGYVAEGNWWDNTSKSLIDGGAIGEMFLLRTDKAGASIWSRKINNVLVNGSTHNAAFVIDGGSIFAVGFKKNVVNGLMDGALVKIPLADGAMDTTCATIQKVAVKEYTFSTPGTVSFKDIFVKDSLTYLPINCTGTSTTVSCDTCKRDTTQLNADFNLYGGLIAGNNTNFIVLANGFSTTPNSQWIVSRTTTNATSSPDLTGTVYPSIVGGTWATATGGTQFGGYNGSSILTGLEVNTPSAFFFIANRYRFRHILSTTNNCGITRSDTVVKTLSMCPGCKTKDGNQFIIETEKGSSSGIIRSSVKEASLPQPADVRIMPNPVSTGTISIEYKNAAPGSVVMNIADIQGKTVATKQFTTSVKSMNKYAMDVSTLSNGVYTVSILNNGKTAVQKIVIAK